MKLLLINLLLFFTFFAQIIIVVKPAAILYVVCFCCYILFSREPDYFDGVFTRGVVMADSYNKKVKYKIGDQTYVSSLENWGASQVSQGQLVTVIYNPAIPVQASLYTFFGYWLHLSELLISAGGFLALLFSSIFITGKEKPYYYSEEELRKKPKYDL